MKRAPPCQLIRGITSGGNSIDSPLSDYSRNNGRVEFKKIYPLSDYSRNNKREEIERASLVRLFEE